MENEKQLLQEILGGRGIEVGRAHRRIVRLLTDTTNQNQNNTIQIKMTQKYCLCGEAQSTTTHAVLASSKISSTN